MAGRVLKGDRRALSRVLSLVESGDAQGRAIMRRLYPKTGQAHVVGITGPTGSGKSTLVFALAKEFRRRGKTVGVVAIDPTSPYTQGALLGDRIRMQSLTSDPGVFIRSMATRGALGGLAATTNDVITVLDAAGKDVILVETVGAGQDEVEIVDTAHTTVVVSVPGAGDEIQTLKAGILEIADILAVNKADQPRADITAKQLHVFLTLDREDGWTIPIIKTVAVREESMDELADAIEKHREFLRSSGGLEAAARQRAQRQLLAAARRMVMGRILAQAEANGHLHELIDAVAKRQLDPHTAASRLIEASRG
ncbi:MAG: methylmalonyl Co-A mutase-associated GTPase MeaB [Chloroflexi bacterium]|nr:methylmalonyl Co-A mutase-associated GTPase MeaB [Chloroflexota bacterium]